MSPLKTIVATLSGWRRYRDAYRELSQLTDRELTDIGVCRDDIVSIARTAAAAH